MTVSTTLAKITYAGNGVTTIWPYPFKLLAETDLEIVITDATGAEQVQIGNYTVAGIGQESGGSVSYPSVGAALPNTHKITLRRVMTLLQSVDLANQGGFYAEVHEQVFDRLVMQDQQLDEAAARALKVPVSVALDSYETPIPVAGRALKWKADLSGLENSASDVDSVAATALGHANAAAADAASAAASADGAATSAADATDAAGAAQAAQILAETAQAGASAAQTLAETAQEAAEQAAADAEVARIEWKGAWSGATAYAIHDAVTSAGTSYICTEAHTDQEPPNASYWDVLALKGADGSGSGDVTGPASAGDGDAVLFDATTGKLIKSAGAKPILAGRHTIWLPALAMVARTTNGPATGTVETTSNKVMFKSLDFDASTIEYAQFSIRMPKSWDEGTISAAFTWSHAATSTNFKVSWGLQGVAISDDDAGDAAFGTAQYANDTGGTTNDIYVSPETAAITVAGSPTAEDWTVFQILRKADDGTNDTLAIDARLHGVTLYYTLNATTDL